ncbi:hypothetical protein ACWIGI_28710 [Nocardia sp. NPDC055321]
MEHNTEALPATEDCNLDVVLAVIQGMTGMANATNSVLIESLWHDANRFRILTAAVYDLADTVDSRRMAKSLLALVDRVCALDADAAEAIAKNRNNFDYPRVDFDAEWTSWWNTTSTSSAACANTSDDTPPTSTSRNGAPV